MFFHTFRLNYRKFENLLSLTGGFILIVSDESNTNIHEKFVLNQKNQIKPLSRQARGT